MCTCITYKNGAFYFGRNLDLDRSFQENIVFTPRNYPLFLRHGEGMRRHYAMLGMAGTAADYPLYAEAVNEKGLCMAALYFPGNACYQKKDKGRTSLASFEVIPWILGRCASVREAKELLGNVAVTDTEFSREMQPAPLHWMAADRKACIVAEPVREGVRIYDNPFGVLTNSPGFEFHQTNMNTYLGLSAGSPPNRLSGRLGLKPYSQGQGALGMPGDFSSVSRFVRAVFLKFNSVSAGEEAQNVAQVFHILGNVSMVRGTVVTEEGGYDMTRYSCCINADERVCYYREYDSQRLRTVRMGEEDPEGRRLRVCEGRAL